MKPAFYPFVEANDELFAGQAWYPVRVLGPMWVQEYSASRILTRLGAEIYNWFRNNPGHVLHEPAGGKHVLDSGSATKLAATEHRFYFKNEKHATAFKEALPGFPYMGSVFPSFQSEMLTLLKNPGARLPISSAIRFALDKELTEVTTNMWFWCLDNLKGRIWENGSITMVELEEDAVLFTLTYAKG